MVHWREQCGRRPRRTPRSNGWAMCLSRESIGWVGGAPFLVLPSQCYENFPRVVIEAFAKGTPVIASKLGGMAEIVDDGRTGLHFKPGDPADLAMKVRSILADPLKLARMRQAARQRFDQYFTADANHKSLMALYEKALSGRPQT